MGTIGFTAILSASYDIGVRNIRGCIESGDEDTAQMVLAKPQVNGSL